jgi:hypothetical protein
LLRGEHNCESPSDPSSSSGNFNGPLIDQRAGAQFKESDWSFAGLPSVRAGLGGRARRSAIDLHRHKHAPAADSSADLSFVWQVVHVSRTRRRLRATASGSGNAPFIAGLPTIYRTDRGETE